ncbi:hypothetical protein C4J98_2358 [Pseudomonas orientalis]|nr:hypothetical protein C4J98_2358 [Pseudomonas orientalis]
MCAPSKCGRGLLPMEACPSTQVQLTYRYRRMNYERRSVCVTDSGWQL